MMNKIQGNNMNEVEAFIDAITNENKRRDSWALLNLLTQASGYSALLHGSMIGFGQYYYKYDSGREGDSVVVAFSPRKQNLVVYIMPGFSKFQSQLGKLGKHKLGKSCLYINKLSDIDIEILAEIVRLSVKEMQKKYDCVAS